MAIPAALIYFLWKRRDLPFPWVFAMFGAFIVSCGFTHFLEVWTFHEPIYRFTGLFKAFTALVSLATAVALVPLVPRALSLRSLAELEASVAERTAELARSEERFRLIIEGVKDYAIFMLDLNGLVLTWNAGAERLKGYRAEEIIGQHFGRFYPPEDRARGKPQLELQQALLHGSFEDEGTRVRKDGSRFVANVVITAVHDPAGQHVGFVKTTRDISERKRAEQRFRAAVESAPMAMVMVDPKGAIVLVNAETEKLFGYGRDELLRRPIEVLVPERYRSAHPELREGFFASPEARRMGAGRDLHGVRKDGSEFPVEIGLNPLETDEGLFVLSAIVDITERKHHEEALRLSEERIRLVVDSALEAVITINEQGRVTGWNHQAEVVFGWTREEVLDQTLAELIIPHRYREQHRAGLERFLATGLGPVLNRRLELSALRKNGEEFPTELTISPLRIGPRFEFSAFLRDISDRKRAEQRFRAAVESAPTAMVMIDGGGSILLVNAQTEKLFGYQREELLGQKVELLVPEPFRAGHPRLREDFFNNPETRRMGVGRDLFGLRKDGSTFPVEIGLNPIETDEGIFVLAAIADISERLAAQAQQMEAVRREVLLKEIHHRVKNNLQVISSLLFLQSTYTSEPKTLEILKESQSRVKSIALIHEKLYRSTDLGKLNFGEYARDLIADLFRTYGIDPETIILKTNIDEVFLEIDTAIPCGLIINELISNAFKHAFPAGRGGEVEVGLTPAGDSEFVLTVRDDGVGLAKDFDWRTSRSFGLKLVVDLTKQLGGKIELDANRGTAFRITFKEIQYKTGAR